MYLSNETPSLPATNLTLPCGEIWGSQEGKGIFPRRLAYQKTIHYLCPENQHVMVRSDTYFGDCKSPYSKPADCKSAGTEKQRMPSVIGGIPLFTKDLASLNAEHLCKICFPTFLSSLPFIASPCQSHSVLTKGWFQTSYLNTYL